MTTEVLEYKKCDGCGRNTLHDKIEIFVSAKTSAMHEIAGRWQEVNDTLDLCSKCAIEDGKIICSDCVSVHKDGEPCGDE